VALGTGGFGAVLLDQLARSEARWNLVGQGGNVLRRLGQFLAEKGFGDPVSPQNGTGPGGAGVFGKSAGKPEDAAPVQSPETADALPASGGCGQTVEFCQLGVSEGVI
jgi:hypothetical protein